MPDRQYFSYIRVSTPRQGQTGTSLIEQQAAIERHAQKNGLTIIKQFEERETAAKQGRPVFLEMIKDLRKGKADGVIIHKVDRSARNLKDWADLGSLMDSGLEVHFAGEGLDLSSRGGRLSADIQAVVASDYIRNLREEVKKGFYGRLKQGLYPRPAPIGYLDKGQGNPKEPDPQRAPLIKQVFQLYATGKYSMPTLVKIMRDQGLRSKAGTHISETGISTILHNPFYTGVMRIEKIGEVFAGKHRPLITQQLFNKVQSVIRGKQVDKTQRHYFLFRRLLTCTGCHLKLIGEKQKGYVYYRCHEVECPQKTVREEVIEMELFGHLKRLRFNEEEKRFVRQAIKSKYGELEVLKENRLQSLTLQLRQCRERLSRLTDFLVDGAIDRELFTQKKNNLVIEAKKLEGEIETCVASPAAALSKAEQFLELVNRAYLSYKWANVEERRELVKFVTSNFAVSGKTISIKLNLPFEMIANRSSTTGGGARRAKGRTVTELVKKLLAYFEQSDSIALPSHLQDSNSRNLNK